MVDPLTTGISLATKDFAGIVGKAFVSGASTRLGGRGERRRVYARFQEAAIANAVYFQMIQYQQMLRPRYMPRPVAEQIGLRGQPILAELLQSFADLQIVANPDPLARAEAVMAALGEVSDVLDDEKQFQRRSNAAGYAVRAFLESSRNDLRYLPQWWEVWRWRWWNARWANLCRWWRGRREKKVSRR